MKLSNYRPVFTIRLKIPLKNYLVLNSLSLEHHSCPIGGAQYLPNDCLRAQIHETFLTRLETVDEGSLDKIREPFLRRTDTKHSQFAGSNIMFSLGFVILNSAAALIYSYKVSLYSSA